jgi:hypothetical protein
MEIHKIERRFTMIELIVGLCLLFGGGIAGWFIRGEVAPKTVNNNTYIENTTTANSIAVAANIDVDENGVHKYITVSIEGITNIVVYTVTNGQTNIIKPVEVQPSWWQKYPP